MKKAIKIIFSIPIVIISCVIIFLGVAFFSMIFTVDEGDFHTVVTEIYNGCYIEDLDSNTESIYYYPNADESKDRVYIVDEWENVIKYTSNGKDIVAFHCIYNQYDSNEKVLFVIYNTKTQKEKTFESQKEFLDFCTDYKLSLLDWQPCNGIGYEKIDLGNDWCVYDFDYPETDKIMNGYGIEYEGFVTDVEKKGNDKVEFIFAVTEWAENEIPDSNKNLDISETVIGEYKFALFGKDEVTYYEKLSLNTETGEITVVN